MKKYQITRQAGEKRKETDEMTMQSIKINGEYRTIATVNDYPPIPTRGFDWCAWIDGREEWQSARGASEQEAIDNLVEMIEDEEAERAAARIDAAYDRYWDARIDEARERAW